LNSVFLAVFALVWFALAYRFYGRFLARRLIVPQSKSTPAFSKQDGVDFYPAKKLVLFGHHFSSIAGAGPILGPVLAVVAFGWGFGALWILIGSVLIGAVHDYVCLMISVREDGDSIPDITGRIFGSRTRTIFMIFVWITLIFVIAVFAIAAAKSFVAKPDIVLPALGLIPLAMLFGWAIYRGGAPLVPATILALAAIAGLIFLGTRYPVILPFSQENSIFFWCVILLAYGYVASVLPVWLLLQPRDYIATGILIFGMGAGFLGLFITHPVINAPFLTGFVSEKQGPIWPMLFIIIACGAISGFHSLVASGTSSKQLAAEKEGLSIGYGGMLTEGVLGILALLAVGAGLKYSGVVNESGPPALSSFFVDGGSGPIAAFAVGYGVLTEPLFGAVSALVGMTMLNAFVITSLDTTVRLTRFVACELLQDRVKVLKNRWVAALAAVIPAAFLVFTGTERSLWPMFGAANQLLGTLALLVASGWLVKKKRPEKYTLYPAIFMLVTTLCALLWQGWKFLNSDPPKYSLCMTAVVLIVLAVFVSRRALVSLGELKKKSSTPG